MGGEINTFILRLFSTREPVCYNNIVIYFSLAKKSGVFRHLLGKHLISEDEYDIITFGAVGRISSFDLWGNIHWQVILYTAIFVK